MGALRLRCKTEDGTQVLNNLTSTSTLLDLMEAIKDTSGIDICFQRILCGFPPKPVNLDNKARSLEALSVKSGDTFIVVNTDKNKKSIEDEKKEDTVTEQPGVRRKEVPADNSCLFYSVFYALEGFLEYETAKRLRGECAYRVITDLEKFTEAVLGKSPDEYSAWIQSDTSWGGAIELSILSEAYQIQIAAVDIKTSRLDIYGEDRGFHRRVYLIYDGIHYDPLYFDPCDKNLPIQTIFPCTDDLMLTKVLELAEDAQKARQYTDTGSFTLICLNCQTKLTGQKEAQSHAKKTGHGNFTEC